MLITNSPSCVQKRKQSYLQKVYFQSWTMGNTVLCTKVCCTGRGIAYFHPPIWSGFPTTPTNESSMCASIIPQPMRWAKFCTPANSSPACVRRNAGARRNRRGSYRSFSHLSKSTGYNITAKYVNSSHKFFMYIYGLFYTVPSLKKCMEVFSLLSPLLLHCLTRLLAKNQTWNPTCGCRRAKNPRRYATPL